MKCLDFVEKAWDYIKDHGYTKNETADYIKNNWDSLEPTNLDINYFIKWAKDNKDKSDYFKTVNLLFNMNLDLQWQFNTICSAMNIFFKQERAQKERDANPSTFQGEINEPITFTVKEKKAISYGNFDSTFYRIVGTDNNVYMWSTSIYFEVGDTIRGKVRDHRDYKWEKQTVIYRGKVIDREPDIE